MANPITIDLNVIGGSNVQKSRAFDSQFSLNIYPFYDPVTQESVMYPYAGRQKILDFSVDPGTFGRAGGMIATEEEAYIAVGEKLFKLDSTLTPTEIGTLDTTSGPVSMDIVNQYLIVVDGAGKWTYDIIGGTFDPIVDADAPTSPTYVVEQQSLALYNDTASQTLYQAAAGFPMNFDALATIQINYKSSYLSYPLIAMSSINGRVFCYTTGFGEVLENEGKVGFSFRPDENLTFGYGLSNATALAKGTGGLMGQEQPEFNIFQSINPDGSIKFMMTTGNPPKVISTPSIEWRVNQFTDIRDNSSFIWSDNGQTFYQINYTTDNISLAYNLNSKQWIDLSIGGKRHPSEAFCYFQGKRLFTSYEDAGLYEMSENFIDNDGIPIERNRVTENIRITGYKNLNLRLLRLWFQQGVGTADGDERINSANYSAGVKPEVYIYVSYDGGVTFDPPQLVDLGKIGERTYVSDVTDLGTGRDITFKLQMFSPVDFFLMGAQLTYIPSEGTQ